jgi:hypothetical protein
MRSRATLPVTTLLLAFALAPIALQAENTAQIIELKHRSAQEIMPLIQPLLAPGGALSGSGYKLILRTSESNRRDIERLLAQLDVPPRTLTITVLHLRVEDAARALQRLEAQVTAGDKEETRVTTGPNLENDATVSRGGNDQTIIRDSTRNAATIRTDTDRQTLRVTEGQPAFLRIGQSVPQIRKIFSYGANSTSSATGAEYANITSGFSVVPHVTGDVVHLDITPRLASLQDPATSLANFQQYATTITTRLGHWTDIGATLATHDAVSNAILEGDTDEASDRWTVLVNVDAK